MSDHCAGDLEEKSWIGCIGVRISFQCSGVKFRPWAVVTEIPKEMAPSNRADKKAAVDAAAWMFNVVSSVGIIIVNKALMANYGFSFGKFLNLTRNKIYMEFL